MAAKFKVTVATAAVLVGAACAVGAGLASPSSATVAECDVSAISSDLGQQLNVERCYGDWAYVSTGELGDAQSLLRLVDGSWVRYTGFPSSICKAQAATDGVPAPEQRSFGC